jgi:hypothetical protein
MSDDNAGAKPATTPDAKPDEPLGDGGRRALESERAARREAEKQLRDAQERVKLLELADTRREVADSKGLTAEQAQYLAGDSREELERSADGLLTAFGRDTGAAGRGRPKEAIRSGSSNGDSGEPDPRTIADRIISRGI